MEWLSVAAIFAAVGGLVWQGLRRRRYPPGVPMITIQGPTNRDPTGKLDLSLLNKRAKNRLNRV